MKRPISTFASSPEFASLLKRAVGLPVVCLLGVAVVLLWQVARLNTLSGWVAHTDEVLSSVSLVQQRLFERQARFRGFLLVGDDRSFGRYEEVAPGVRERLVAVDALVHDDPRQQERVRELRTLEVRWETCTRKMIDERRTTGLTAATGLTSCSEPVVDRALDVLEAMETDERGLRASRLAQERSAAVAAVVTGILLTFGVAILLGTFGRRQLVSLSRTYSEALARAERQTDALTESEARVSAIVGSAMDAIITVDDRQRIVLFNDAAQRVFGWAPADVLGQPLDVLIPDRFRSGHSRDLTEFSSTGVTARSMGRPGHLVGLRKTGTEFPIEATISQVKVLDHGFYTVILRDITERERTERELRESEERFRLFVSAAHEYAIVMLDPDGHVVSWNPGAERITGYRADAIVGRSIDVLFSPESRSAGHVASALAMAVRDGTHLEEREQVRHDGSRYHAELTTIALRDARGGLRGFAHLERDITERKRAEAALRRHAEELEARVAERTAALGDINAELNAFAYSVSHDLRAPLRSMQGFAEALIEDYGDRLDETGRDYATRVVNASKRMDLLIQDLLAYSRLTRADIELRPVDVGQLAQAIVAQNDFAVRHNGACIDVVEPIPPVRAHRATLTQVLTNLLSNAVKFVAPGIVPRVVIRGARQDGRVRVWVEDNGIGIQPEHQERIFRVFERLHPLDVYPGTGIGLAIVRKGVERMGGRVGLESQMDRGTRFWFELASAPEMPASDDGD